MNKKEETKAALLAQNEQYPELRIQDFFKFIYQSSFGCEHLLSDVASAETYIRKEAESQQGETANGEPVEPLDGDYCRVHLSYLKEGLSPETFAKLFVRSAEHVADGQSALEKKLEALTELVAEKKLPFAPEELATEIEEWKNAGYPACHHSEQFREKYHPAYRLMKKEYARFLPLFAKLDGMLAKGPVKLAIEGGSASGKTTFSALLQELYDCTVFHMDDFFLRPEQRTPERFAEPGGNVDRERFLEEVLSPLRKGKTVVYRPFDCSTFSLGEPVTELPRHLTVIEGAYSMHPELRGYYDLSVFLDVSPELQKERIGKRNSPEMAKRFFAEWIPMEQKYFETFRVKEQCDVIISVGGE